MKPLVEKARNVHLQIEAGRQRAMVVRAASETVLQDAAKVQAAARTEKARVARVNAKETKVLKREIRVDGQ